VSARVALAMATAAVVGACSPSPPSSALEELRLLQAMELVGPQEPGGDWQLWGRYEATRGEVLGETDRDLRDLPVTMITATEAAAWCAGRGLRLPTETEWQQMPVEGGAGFETVPPQDRNGLELNLGRPLPVGVFERGRTPLGLYDIYGNVREMAWTEDGGVRAYGGSYAAREASRDPREQLEMGAESRAEDVGFRYVADATAFFLEQVVPRWESLEREEREELILGWAEWRREYRLAFARRLRERGAPDSLAAALEELPEADGA
jgi:hypothetical protein